MVIIKSQVLGSIELSVPAFDLLEEILNENGSVPKDADPEAIEELTKKQIIDKDNYIAPVMVLALEDAIKKYK